MQTSDWGASRSTAWLVTTIKFVMSLNCRLSINFKRMCVYHQIDKVILSVNKSLYLINRVKHLLNQNLLRMLYSSLINSHLNYGLIFWGYGPKYKINIILKLQKRAMRMITGLGYRDHTQEIFKRLNVLKIDDLTKFNAYLFMYDIIKGKVPTRIKQLFPKKTVWPLYQTRPKY